VYSAKKIINEWSATEKIVVKRREVEGFSHDAQHAQEGVAV
jgi:hypothetical protein